MTNAIKSQGTLVEVESLPKGSGVWTAIGEVQSVPASGADAPEIEATHLRSTAKEFLRGLRDEGAIQFQGNYLGAGGDPGQDIVYARWTDGQECNWRITLADATTTQGVFAGFVKNWDFSAQPNSKVDLQFTVRKTGAMTVA